MSYTDRLEIYRRIEELRRRPLLVYVTSIRHNASGTIAADVIPEFVRHIKEVPPECEEIDLLIVSNGGDGTVSSRIICILRERFKKIAVLLPYAAYSAATLLALGADEIYMHPFSNLGPVDPQLSYTKPGTQERISFGAEDLRNFINFVREDVGLTDQALMGCAFELLCKEIGSIPIGRAKRSSQLSLSLGEKLLSLHMKDSNKAKTIAEALNRSFYHHGYALGRTEAKKIDLPVIDPDTTLEDLMWQVWENISQEWECEKHFDLLETALKNAQARARLTAPVKQADLPVNIPPQLLNQVMQHILGQINYSSADPVDYELFSATLETLHSSSRYKIKGKIFAVRQPTMDIKVNNIVEEQGWETQAAPEIKGR